jgi:hypothetical protein
MGATMDANIETSFNNMRLDDLLFGTMYRYFLSPLVVNAVTKE